jgi:hypothetical protein
MRQACSISFIAQMEKVRLFTLALCPMHVEGEECDYVVIR